MKENLDLALTTELVTVMDPVPVTPDGLTLLHLEKSAIAQLPALETAQEMVSVNVEFANVTQDSNFSQTALAKIVMNNVPSSKCVDVTENVPASQDFLDLTARPRPTVDP